MTRTALMMDKADPNCATLPNPTEPALLNTLENLSYEVPILLRDIARAGNNPHCHPNSGLKEPVQHDDVEVIEVILPVVVVIVSGSVAQAVTVKHCDRVWSELWYLWPRLR